MAISLKVELSETSKKWTYLNISLITEVIVIPRSKYSTSVMPGDWCTMRIRGIAAVEEELDVSREERESNSGVAACQDM